MRAPPGDRRVTEPVGYQNHGQAGRIANDDQGDNYNHGYGHHGHAHRHRLGHHGHAGTDARDLNSDGDTHDGTSPGADPVSHRYGG